MKVERSIKQTTFVWQSVQRINQKASELREAGIDRKEAFRLACNEVVSEVKARRRNARR